MKCYASAVVLLALSFSLHAQVKIGNNPTNININSILELETTNKGFVLPRVSLISITSSAPLSATVLEGTFVYNTNASATGGSGTGLYYWTGAKWQYIVSAANTNAWQLTGNAGTNSSTNFLGTTDNASLSFYTNNTQRMYIDSATGDVAIGTNSFDPVNPARLRVVYGTTTSHTVGAFYGTINDYLQINFQNKSSGSSASTDFVATADNGTDSTYYVDFGINSSNYAPSVENFGGPNDGYLYANARNLLIGTQAQGSDLIFMVAGNKISANTAMRINGTNGNIIIGRGENTLAAVGNTIRGSNSNTTGNGNGGTITIQGGKGNGTGTGGSININAGIAGSSGATGSVNINANTVFPTNIGTGTTTQDITLGGNANNFILPKYNIAGGLFYTSLATGQLANTGANMTWDSINNRLGIGITSPAYKLHVVAASNPLFLAGVQATSAFTTDSILTIFNGIVKKTPYSSLPTGGSGSGWLLTGNSITSGQFLGTTNAQALVLKAQGNQMAYFDGNVQSLALGFGAVNNSSDHNVAIGFNASTNNQYALALGYSATATGVRSVAIGNGGSATTASGAESIAIGFNSTSTADQTVSLGYQGRASGQYGIAIGYNPTASGSQSVAIGYQAQATQQYSSAIGYQAQATGLQSTAIGYNAQTSQANTILLGNAGASNVYVGIGTATPSTKLQIVGGNGVNPLLLQGLPTGVATDNFLTVNPTTGVVNSLSASTISGTFWGLSGNAATNSSFLGTTNAVALQFKYNNTLAGYLDANNTSFGTSASATSGSSNTAIGTSATAANSATAVGANANASAVNNTAVGNSAIANNSSQETAIGAAATANAQYNTAVGNNAQAISNSQATALGYNSLANGFQSVAVGVASQAVSNAQTTAVGVSALANSQYNTALGYNTQAISNSQATALGSTAKANAQYSTSVGYNAQAITNSYTSALGTNSIASGQYGSAFGAEADATTQYSTAIGYGSQAVTANQTTAVGASSVANSINATALGYNAKAQANNSTAIGYNAQTSQANTLLLGDATNNSLNVGIGTGAPAYKLHVLASSNPLYLGGVQATSTLITDSVLTINAGIVKKSPVVALSANLWQITGNTGTTASTSAIGSAVNNNFIGTTDAKDFVLATNNLERMRMTSSGNVGINITAPEVPLHIVKYTAASTTPEDVTTIESRLNSTSSVSAPPQLNIVRQVPTSVYANNTTNVLGPIISFGYRTPGASTFADVAQIQATSLAGNSILNFYTRTGEINGNPNTGNIASNMSLTGNTLNVANLTGGNTGSLSADANGNIIRTASDVRLKTNIISLDSALTKVLKLHGVEYSWKDTKRFGTQREIGFIAQEVEKVMPQVVSNGVDYKSVNYQVLTALLTEAMKEQQNQIENQKATSHNMQKTLEEQQKLISQLINEVKDLKEKVQDKTAISKAN